MTQNEKRSGMVVKGREGSMTLVVCPLVSLSLDQMMAIEKLGEERRTRRTPAADRPNDSSLLTFMCRARYSTSYIFFLLAESMC